jgi:hypothetical protein
LRSGVHKHSKPCKSKKIRKGECHFHDSCDGLMHKNGEPKVDEFVCVESRCLLYTGSRRHSCNLTDMHQKASACIGLCVGMVPESYHQ